MFIIYVKILNQDLNDWIRNDKIEMNQYFMVRWLCFLQVKKQNGIIMVNNKDDFSDY